MTDIKCTLLNHSYMRIEAPDGILREIAEYFTFKVPNYQHQPAYKNGLWDGNKRMFNMRTQRLYVGLYPHLALFAKERSYTVDRNWLPLADVHEEEIVDFFKTTPMPFKPHDYQLRGFMHAIRHKRAVLLSPTSSGKSFLMYLLTKWCNKRTLIVVPTTNLVLQMRNDFISYGLNGDEIQIIMEGYSSEVSSDIVVSTWQSVYEKPDKWFEQFDVVLGDEAHGFKANSLTSIMDRLVNAEYRIGLTGTLDGAQTHKLMLEGMFGRVFTTIRTKAMMDQGASSSIDVRAITLHYPEDVCKAMSRKKFPEEIAYLCTNQKRNEFIRSLVKTCVGNTIVLFQFIEKHGKLLRPLLETLGRPVYYVDGSVDVEDREEIRQIMGSHNDAIILASVKTFSTGVNIPSLRHVILASPTKSRIRLFQTIGRGLRKDVGKTKCVFYDLGDCLQHGIWINYAMRHYRERLMMYAEEEFPVKHYKVYL